MTHQPRRTEDIKSDIRTSLEGEIPGLTNFVDGSFNDTWIDAHAQEVREIEVKIVAAQLALWVDYAGNDSLTQTDLERTGISFTGWSESEIDDFLSDLNALMEDIHLDRIGDLVGIERGQGQKATGEVTITTASSSTQVNEGLEVSTQPDANGEYVSFFVDANSDGEISGDNSVTPSTGTTTVTVDIIAENVGDEYNVGANAINFLPSPDPGIESVNNATETSGGSGVQENSTYREDLKGAVITQSGGGTAEGIEGEIENVDGVSDAETDEFQDDDPPHVDVIVDGGSESELITRIDDVKPTGIRHDLVRPEDINVGYRTEVIGSDIDSTFVVGEIEDMITSLSLSEAFRRVKLVQRIMNSDLNIEDIGDLSIFITSIENESHEFSSGTNTYELNLAPLGLIEGEEHLFKSGTDIYNCDFSDIDDSVTSTLTAIVDGDETDLTEGTDYNLIDDNNDGNIDSVDFSPSATDPDDRTVFEIEYELNDAAVNSNTVTGTLSGTEDHEFTEGTDYNLTDDGGDGLFDTIDWSVGGDNPDDGTLFFVNYDPKRILLNDKTTTVREKIGLDGSRTELTITSSA